MRLKRNLFKHLTILQKLLLLIIIPLSCAGILCIWYVNEEKIQIDELSKLDNAYLFSVQAEKLSYALSKEQYYSALYLGLHGQDKIKELEEARKTVDDNYIKYQSLFKQLDENLQNDNVINANQGLSDLIKTLQEQREKIDKLEINILEVINYYSEIGSPVYDLACTWEMLNIDSYVDSPLTGYTSFIDFKRYYETASSLAIYVASSNDPSLDILEKLVTAQAKADVNATYVEFYAGDIKKSLFDDYLDVEANQYLNHIKNDLKGHREPHDWQVIDSSMQKTFAYYQATGDVFKKELLKRADLCDKKHHENLFKSILLIAFITIITSIISIMIINNLTNPIEHLVEILSMVTKGQLDINSSIDGSDELTAISNTLDKTLEALRNAADEGVKSTLIINSMETGVMLVDKDGCINYANNSAKKYADELSKLSKKFSSNNLVGSNFVDIFELAPNFTNEYLSNARGLPLEKTVELAHEFISTRLYAVNNAKGEFSSVLVCFESVTKKIAQANRDRLIKETIEDNIGTLSRSSKELEESAYELTTSVESITCYSQELEQRLTGVSSFTGDMVTDIDQIAEGTRDIMARTMVLVENNHIVEKIALELSKRSKEVEDVIKFVRDIAEETNLLALNATIEAVRAGEAGKGFAVVANEVKGLAKKTADATEDIQNKVAQIKEATNKTVESITFTNEHIDHINQTISSITSSVDRQSSLTRQIGSDVGSSVTKIQDISKNIETINSKVSENLKQAEEIFGVTGLLSNLR